METVILRPMSESDAGQVARLAGQLGYPSSRDEVALRFAVLSTLARDWVRVAERSGGAGEAGAELLGLIHARIDHGLLAEPKIEIKALIVDESARGRGVGARLVRAAESWAKEQGMSRLFLRTNVMREAAQRFYLREGYLAEKTSVRFVKDISQG